MSDPFKGKINIDIRDSVPDWTPFEPPKAPDGAPSVLYIVLDDVGFSAIGSYGEQKVGEGQIKTQPATFGLTGSGLTIGRSLHAITYDYPGERPWAFTGGNIHFAAVDVSGEPYVDLEREAAAMIARE